MSLDLNYDYDSAKKKIQATSAYKDLKTRFDELEKKRGETQEQSLNNIQSGLDSAKKQTKRFQKQVKNQFEQLLDMIPLTGEKGSNTTSYIKRLLIQTLKNLEPRIAEIINDEAISAIGCDQQQTFSTNRNGGPICIDVKSLDLGGLLKQDPFSSPGKVMYEKQFINIQNYPFSMNRELYQRIQSGQPYSTDNSSFYLGKSGQGLFDIRFNETNGCFEVTLLDRANGINRVGDFILDYYGSIKIFDFETVLPAILEALCGAISIKASVGLGQAKNSSQFAILIQRILGLCFDNSPTGGVSEIDVSGIAKLAELDGIDNSFYEFTDIDLRNLDQKFD